VIEEELEFWQLPSNIISAHDEKLGNKLANAAIEVVRRKVQPVSLQILDLNYYNDNVPDTR
jgi:hypothetical protein